MASLMAGCDSTEAVKVGEASAEYRCLQLAALRLGLVTADTAELPIADDGDSHDPSFRFASTGLFVAEFKSMALPGATRPSAITCTGDYNRRQITSLQIDGALSRPAKPEDWVF